MRVRVLLGLVAALALSQLAGSVRASTQTFVAPGSAWRYNDAGVNLGAAWATAAFDDQAWPTGLAQLGYGDGDESTVLSDGGNPNARHLTYYFRRTFDVTDAAGVTALQLRVMRDDGLLVYLNGAEVMRSNMPAGAVSHTTLATTAVSGADENAWLSVPVDPARLVAGANLIAVEVHQQSASSSDVTFDLELTAAVDVTPPAAVTLTTPGDGAVLNLHYTTLGATVAATAGLARATLLVGGAPQTLAFSGAAATVDAQITADTPTVPAASGLAINVDGQGPHAHGLMAFPQLLGARPGQMLPGSTVVSATLTVNCTNTGAPLSIYRVIEAWIPDQATWNERFSGQAWGAPGADGAASYDGAAVVGSCSTTGSLAIDVTRIVQEWSDGAPNHGVVVVDSGTDGVDFSSSEAAVPPVLSVTFRSQPSPAATQVLSGTTADVAFPVLLPSPAAFTWNIEVADANGLVARAPADHALTVDWTLPDAPVVVSPADGASGVDPADPLVAIVGAPAGGPITAAAGIRPASGQEFTIVVLPDTQHYSEAFPAVFTAQTQWIVANKAARNIVFVTHEGDVVEHWDDDAEWQAANASMSLLDGVVPYGLAPGNHDQPSTFFNQYFPFSRYLGLPWYGGHYQTLNDNNFQLFSGGGLDFVAVHLEFCPSSGAVAWARGVFDAHPGRIGMMTTHGYLNGSAQRTVHGGCASTQYLWDSLGAVTPNLHFMLSGHVHAEARRQDVANGHPVFQMLADYQDRASGGNGWLRILRFVPTENRVYVQTYSPWLNQFEVDADSQFVLDFAMTPPFTSLGPVVVPSGATASFTPALQPSTTYEWRVTAANDAGGTRTSPTWTFTTGAGLAAKPERGRPLRRGSLPAPKRRR